MNFRITDIRNFVATSQCKTIIQAAQKLEISQPALSESLMRLESDLGETVFYRSRTGIELTSSGKLFLKKAEQLLKAYSDLSLKKNDEDIFAGQRISIGCHHTVAQYSIPNAVSYIRSKAKDYEIELIHDLSRNIQSEVQKGKIDIGIVVNATAVPDLVMYKLSVDTVGVWKKTNGFDDSTIICHQNLFQTQSILKKWKNKPNKIIHTDSLELICRMVDEGIGYGILPQRAVELVSDKKIVLCKNLPTFSDEIYLIYRPEFGRNRPEKLIIEAIKNTFK